MSGEEIFGVDQGVVPHLSEMKYVLISGLTQAEADKSRGDHRFGTFQTMRTFLHFGDHGNGLHGPWKFFWFSTDHVVN